MYIFLQDKQLVLNFVMSFKLQSNLIDDIWLDPTYLIFTW